VLADGRDVSGSRWATITGQSRVPDLRGGFLRAAGQNNNAGVNWNGKGVGTFHDDTTRIPRNTALTGTTSSAGGHFHASGVPVWNDGNGGFYGTIPMAGRKSLANYDENSTVSAQTSTDGAHTHTVSITAGGDVETAPAHFSLNTFIKIN
jgi:hypothetical protein